MLALRVRKNPRVVFYFFVILLLIFICVPSSTIKATGDVYDTNTVADRPCKDVLTLFVRGSGQTPAGSNYNQGLEYIEPQTFAFFEDIHEQLSSNYPELTIDRLTLQDFPGEYNTIGYQAAGVIGLLDDDFFTGYNAVVNHVQGTYKGSVDNGAEELEGFLKDQVVRCPNEMIILGGYSQGADLIGQVLWKFQNDNAQGILENIDYVMLFGDPKFSGFENLGDRKFSRRSYTRGDVKAGQSGILQAREPYMPEVMSGKFTSWCDDTDLVCAGVYYSKLGQPFSHTDVYQNEGLIEKAALEMFVTLQDDFAELAQEDVSIRRSNTPLSGITYSFASEIMLLFDTSSDMDRQLEYGGSRGTLSKSIDRLMLETPVLKIGLGATNESKVPYGDLILPSSTILLDLSPAKAYYSGDKWYSPIMDHVGKTLLYRFYGGAGGGQDSLLGGIQKLIDEASWTPSTTSNLVYFTNTYGFEPEPFSHLTKQQVVDAANAKNIQLLPVFYSRRYDASWIPESELTNARAFHQELADKTGGHVTEFYPRYEGTNELYDIINGHSRAPTVAIDTGKFYSDPWAAGMFFGVGQEVYLTSTNSIDPDSLIDSYSWDFDGDGVSDADTMDAAFTYDAPYNGPVTLSIISKDGTTASKSVEVQVETPELIDTLPQPVKPQANISLDGNTVSIVWEIEELDSLAQNVFVGDSEGEPLGIFDSSALSAEVLDESATPGSTYTFWTVGSNGESEKLELVLESEQKEFFGDANPAGIIVPDNSESTEVSVVLAASTTTNATKPTEVKSSNATENSKTVVAGAESGGGSGAPETNLNIVKNTGSNYWLLLLVVGAIASSFGIWLRSALADKDVD